MTRLNSLSMIGTTLRSRTVQNVALGLGSLASVLIFASGIIEYPLITVLVESPLGVLIVVVGGIWLGAIWPARLVLGVGNAAVIVGFAGLWTLFGLSASGSINPTFFFGAALMFALGYALVAMSVARGLLTIWRAA